MFCCSICNAIGLLGKEDSSGFFQFVGDTRDGERSYDLVIPRQVGATERGDHRISNSHGLDTRGLRQLLRQKLIFSYLLVGHLPG